MKRPFLLITGWLALAAVAALPSGSFVAAQPAKGFDRTEAMIETRDGAKLFTLVFTPKGAEGPLPFVFVRTPYGIDFSENNMRGSLKELADDGYIFVFQDIRGRYKSEGTFVMCRPARNAADPKAVDEASDTQDTIDWLLKNIPNNNGRVGMLGVSYPGWLAAVAMLDPHPALKAVSPQASPCDMFFGDDFHHNGAFRLSYGFEYTAMMETDKKSTLWKFDKRDTYEWYLNLGGLANVNARVFKNKYPTWNDFAAHPNYDEFWKKQSLEPRLTRVTVPTLDVGGWYDQEDFRGPLRIYNLLERHDTNNQNFIVVGPWNHGGWQGGPGNRLGAITFGEPSGPYYREKVQAPFFAHYLKDKGKPTWPEALMFQTGTNKWVSHDAWPPKTATAKKLYLRPNGKLAFDPPADTDKPFDAYTSDPANPVPYRPRPILATYQGPGWSDWMLNDQRFTQHRPDVLTYETDLLTEDVVLAGPVKAKLFAATSGTDADWIVRLIDVYPDPDPTAAAMSGYQLLIAGEPCRGRFRNSYEKPEPVMPDQIEAYTVDLVESHHCFRKGHRIMIQVSSTWFPVIDRNPQRFVQNIYDATDADFQVARQRVFRTPKFPSHMELTVQPNAAKEEGR